MPYIRVNLQNMQHTSDTLQKIEKGVGRIEDSFRYVSGRLDWDVKREHDIDRMLRCIDNELEEEERMLRSMKTFLDYAIARYEELEHRSMYDVQIKNKSVKVITPKSLTEFSSELLNRMGDLIKCVSKIEDDDTGEFAAGILEYCYDFIQMFTGGDGEKSDGVRWLNLADSSCGLWKGFYEILHDGLANEEMKALFESKFGDAASMIGITGSLAGFLGACLQADKTGEPDDYGDLTKSIVGVGKELYLTIFEPESSYPAHVYTSIIKSGVDFSVQIGESVQKYSQDGEWSIKDTGATGIEASITGLNTLISGFTYGVVSLESIGSSPEEVSEVVISGAENWGTKAGEMIRDDPELKKEYDEGSGFRKTRMLLWAIGKTGIMYLQS